MGTRGTGGLPAGCCERFPRLSLAPSAR
jgi:hypothetical protein